MSGVTPQAWFLTESETRQRPGHTSGNRVTALVDGQSYMTRLQDRLGALAPGGYLHLAGWRLTPDVRLVPDQSGAPTIGDIVAALANAAVTVRSLLWFVPGTIGDFGAGHGAENLAMTQAIEALGAEAVLDDRLPAGTFASHHHKFVVLGDAAGDAAYVGGIDIALDRWDRPAHDEPAGRQRELFDGWHDVQAEVEGPAVGQIWDSFAERWNDPRRPNGAPLTAGGAVPTPIPGSARPAPGAAGTCHVQVLHTYPCQTRTHRPGDSPFYPFAPAGDRSYEAGLVKAIAAAEHYVYLEDQYLWPCRVVDALAEAVGRGVTAILVLTNNYDVPGLIPYHNFLRQSCVEQLRQAGPGRVFVFHLSQNGQGGDDIYVHSKTMIVDDRYAVIGTGNVNRRSMSTDTEIAVAIVDEVLADSSIGGQALQTCGFARDYRIQLWREHLGATIADPLNADGSPNGWPVSASAPAGHVHVHTVPEPRFCDPSFIPLVLMNPETACP